MKVLSDAALRRRLNALGFTPSEGCCEVVSSKDLEHLPSTVQRYFDFMGVLGKPKIWSLRATLFGRFRPRLRASWSDCSISQYSSNANEIIRYFAISLKMGPYLPVVAEDIYFRGKGSMKARVFGRFPVASASGIEADIGELVTYLNDGILLAPSMLLRENVTWVQLNARSFQVSLSDDRHRVTARVDISDHGAPECFSTFDRYFFENTKKTFIRTPWSTPIHGWLPGRDRVTPASASAVWHTPGGDFPYAEVDFSKSTLQFNRVPKAKPSIRLFPTTLRSESSPV